jgi:protein-tyrosine phosphatase
MAAEDGIRTTVCTPHIDFKYLNDRASIEAAFGALREAVQREKIPLELVIGAEVHMSPDIVPKLQSGELVTYNDGKRYLLLEFPFQQVISGVDDLIYRLRLAGVTPVVAHPERIGYFMDNLDRLHQVIRLGALGQITGGSLVGQFGVKSQQASLAMVKRQLVHVVASDAHDHSYRRPVLSEAAAEIERLFGAERARAMLIDWPAAIVAGEDIEPPEPIESAPKVRSFFSSFFSRRPAS